MRNVSIFPYFLFTYPYLTWMYTINFFFGASKHWSIHSSFFQRNFWVCLLFFLLIRSKQFSKNQHMHEQTNNICICEQNVNTPVYASHEIKIDKRHSDKRALWWTVIGERPPFLDRAHVGKELYQVCRNRMYVDWTSGGSLTTTATTAAPSSSYKLIVHSTLLFHSIIQAAHRNVRVHGAHLYTPYRVYVLHCIHLHSTFNPSQYN